MRKKCGNNKVVKGDLFGADVEPGTFCAKNASCVSGNDSEMPVTGEEVAREGLEDALAPDGLIPPAGPDGIF